jgi:hypothetical protein
MYGFSSFAIGRWFLLSVVKDKQIPLLTNRHEIILLQFSY